MNRYQLEIAEMDRRRLLAVRALSIVGAAVLVIAALWSAGVPPALWWERAHAWWSGSEALSGPTSQAVVSGPAPDAPVITETPVYGPMHGTESSVSERPQPLFLITTMPGRNKNEGSAQIGTDPDNPQTYIAGALLANGARLEEIHLDYVLLKRRNESAKLPLFRRDSLVSLVSNELLSIRSDKGPKLVVPVTRVLLTDYLRPSPLYDGERLLGYQVYPGAKAGVFARLGLQAGDVITAINGQLLSEPHQAMELFGELTRGVAVTAAVERDSEVHWLALDGALILADLEAVKNAAAQSTAIPAPPPT